MELSEPQREKVLEKLHELWGSNPCELCGWSDWDLSDHLLELREFAKGALLVGGVVVPLVALYCTRCGNVRLANAIALGILNPITGELGDG